MNRTMLRWPVLAALVVLALAGTATAHATNQFVVQCASTLASLQPGPSTCGTPAGVDNAAYWMPAMWIGQTRYLPKYARVYYVRDAPTGVTVVPYPPGAMMIAGDKADQTPSPGNVSFTCDAKTVGDQPT